MIRFLYSINFILLGNVIHCNFAAPSPQSFKTPGEPLNPSDFAAAAQMSYDKNTQGSTPYLSEKMFQDSLENRNGLTDDEKLWSKFGDFVFIPYIIAEEFSRTERHVITKAFENFHEHTCIRFIPRTHQADHLYFVYGDGCDSEAGRVPGGQTISLGEGCTFTHVAIHEINHAVGFWHEHNRPDRDHHITVYLDNVKPENQFNFKKMSPDLVHSFGQKYDTSSIMHYDEFAFSIDPGNLVVIEPDIPDDQMGYAQVLSKTDIAKINRMYKCGKLGVYKPAVHNPVISELNSNECIDAVECSSLEKKACVANIWVQANCKKLCGRCGQCQDLHKNCRMWMLKGACQTQLDYMYIYCPESCLECP